MSDTRKVESFVVDRTDRELFATYDSVLRELHKRGLVRTMNNPVADYAELLVAYALDGVPLKTGTGHDVKAGSKKIEVKSRRNSVLSKPTHFGWIRNFEDQEFTHLALVLFNQDFSVARAHLLTRTAVAGLIGGKNRRVGAQRVAIGALPPEGQGIKELDLRIPPATFRWQEF